MPLFRKSPDVREDVDFTALPRHVAIIMDGNGRWAKQRGLPRTAGHAAGAETFRTIATYCKEIGLDYLTVYAFSTENWKRPQEEVAAIMRLLKKYLLDHPEIAGGPDHGVTDHINSGYMEFLRRKRKKTVYKY